MDEEEEGVDEDSGRTGRKRKKRKKLRQSLADLVHPLHPACFPLAIAQITEIEANLAGWISGCCHAAEHRTHQLGFATKLSCAVLIESGMHSWSMVTVRHAADEICSQKGQIGMGLPVVNIVSL